MNSDRQKLYEDFRHVIYERQLANSKIIDKAILVLGSAGLAGTMTVAEMESAMYLFAAAVVSTIFSLMCSQAALKKQLCSAKAYYLDADEHALNRKNIYSWCTEIFNFSAGVLFVAAVVMAVLSVSKSI